MFTEYDEEDFYRCSEALPYLNEKIGRITGMDQTYLHRNEDLVKFGFRGVEHLILNQAEGQIHTGEMMRALIQKAHELGVQLFNGLHIAKIDPDAAGVTLHTPFNWNIRAAKVLVTTNGFANDLLPELEDLYPARNIVLITKPVAGLRVKGCFHYDAGFYYFRDVEGRILLGGGRNLAADTEKTSVFGVNNDLIKSALVNLLRNVILPGQPVEIEGWWSGILGLGPQKKPIIRWVAPNVAVAVRMGGMGVAIGSLVGEEAAELVAP